MDKKIQDALREAVREAGQDPSLARKLEMWFEAIASGSEDVNDKQSANRHLELLYEDTRVSGSDSPSAWTAEEDDNEGQP
jgi:hypothetical protein